ncbi:DnaJ domain protein [Beauveria brongniartii RCEF 3172]|uniref:DnaJ domain protein n=1 Tax=Beauveria brongniartii RCEF 3172 TaxID=1081107 RepID=A0A166ZHX3_9HYPO|nr:DnaJ domain protein [Beauveria brongniartii RCEF 3172]
MAALARAAPCPRLFLRSTTTTSSSSPQPAPSPPRLSRRIVRCSAAAYYSTTSLWLAPPSSCQQQQQQRRSFCCTRSVRRDLAKRNHYERLQVPQSATPGDIKKSFYKLSKTHHPDANRKDPNAAHTFSLLSESYTLLSDPSRRSLYDRDVMARLHPPSYAHSPPHGSYHSAAHHHHHPAGGRPASGLSKRRGSFRGPPPSFYRNGGWGAHADRRRRAHDETTASSSSSSHYTNYESPGHGRLDDEGVPLHFDKEAHRRTHEKEDRRRWARRRRALDEEGVEFEPQTSLGAHFAIVLGILGATVLVPVWYWNTVSGKRRKEF